MAMSQAVTMKKLREIVLPIFVILCADVTNGELGAVCNKVTDCSMGGYCMQGTCNCSEIWYAGNSLTPVCRSWEYERLCSRDDECGEDAKCKNVKCECNRGFYRINASCRKVTLQRLLQPCKINLYRTGTALCDIRKHSTCIRNTCVCTKGYVANEHGQCELKDSYLVRMEMSEYRVTTGEYCRDDTDCIEGLECKGFECRCPSGCMYIARRNACDCGEVDTHIAPIVLGVFLGMVNIAFWYWAIYRTIVKHKEKIIRLSYRTAIDNDDVSSSHPLSPVQSSVQTGRGTGSLASTRVGTPIRDSGTSRPDSINPPTAPALDNPPSYDEVISSPTYNPNPSSLLDLPNPPSYIHVSTGTLPSASPIHSPSRRPYSSLTPTAPPYLISPHLTLRPGSLDAIPHHVNSSTPVHRSSSALHSSVPDIQRTYNRNLHESNVAGSADTDGPSRF
ncbi:uncharacterized protein LOC134787264 isoform X1 [Penaeus indicus]|uniref:uncharacterized protein LOC134787264 isoform X1 n=1 Tax=Penaeus indicus TaxID=29960 RepID=UPI00300CC06C